MKSLPFLPRVGASGLKRLLLAPPHAALDLMLQRFVDGITTRHADAFSRLTAKEGTVFCITATDLGLSFLLTIRATGLRLKTETKRTESHSDVAIRAPIRRLIELLEGETDGDALFFSRDIDVSGDTEALVMLRNAVDSANIDFQAEFVRFFGPFEPVAQRAVCDIQAAVRLLSEGAHKVQRWASGPVYEQLDTRIGAVRNSMNGLEERLKRLERRRKPASEGIAQEVVS